ncbi:MAG TPA: 6-carboxytetrahydropterin synthase QueD [Armatimonadota bacterium]|jgi:6-pyruvoyltetrahydropterin/6-carboxytetrahydropterin synthase
MYELTVERQFAAAHQLRGYDGPCARLHGHNYRLLVVFSGAELDADGFLADFTALKAVCDQVLEGLDHQFLNDLPAFGQRNPTAENLAAYLYRELRAAATDLPVRVQAVTLYESDTSAVTYREE